MTPLLPIHFDDEVANPCSAAQVLYLLTPPPFAVLPPCATFHQKKKMLLLFLFSFRSFPRAKEAISL